MFSSLRIAATLAFLSVFSMYAQTDDAAGWVLSADGTWTASAKGGQPRKLQAGVVVKPGESLQGTPADANLGLVLYDGTYLRCGRSNPSKPSCKQPIAIPERAKSKGILSAFMDQLTNKHLPPVAFVTSRGAQSAPPPVELRDAVLPVNGNTLDLTFALNRTAPEDLHFYLEPLDAPKGCTDLIFTLPKSAQSAKAPGFQPGCEGLYILSSTDSSMQGVYPATVLFVPPAKQARAEKMLEDASHVTAGWQSAAENEVRTFRRLTLGAIQQSLRSER
jgi:hypothetical protein